MNLIRQRDDLKAACAAKCISPEQLEMALSSPVFQWWPPTTRELTDEEWEFMSTYILEETYVPHGKGEDEPEGHVYYPKNTPYECFRISHMDTPIYEQWWIGEQRMVCLRCDDGYSNKDVKLWSVHGNRRGDAQYKLWIWINGYLTPLTVEGNDGWVDNKHGVRMLYKKEEMTDFTGLPTKGLAHFLFDIYSSTCQVLKVSPDQPQRSVQWRQAREHYLVLRRKDAERMSRTRDGHTEGDLVRAAHWRRAHLRRLSSHKFINKRGLLVPVRKAWVGPLEWKGKDGKIYTVVGIKPAGLPA